MTTDNLTFSIIVSTMDRAGSILTLLRSLEHQSYPYFEVIVVVGPTHDNTLEVLRKYGNRIRILDCPSANLSQSRNIGLLAARGDVIAFIDDDAVPCYRWLEQLARLVQMQSLDATGGAVYTIHPNHSTVQHRFGIASCLAEQIDVLPSRTESVMISGKGVQWIERMMGTNMAVRRDRIIEIGGFDEFYQYIAEETDLAFRMVNAGMLVHPVREAVVYHIPASSRNRTVFTNKGKWWLRSRSRIYFAIKNGSVAGQSVWTIAWQGLRAIGAHWLWYARLLRSKQLPLIDFFVLAVKELPSGLDAVRRGAFGPRKLLDSKVLDEAGSNSQGIHKYQDDQSHLRPTVDPVNGYCPSVILQDPPLRICLLSSTYPPAQYDGIGRQTFLLARGLFERGHAVHVIARGERDQISFYEGAYIHRITPRLDRYTAYRSYPNLFHTLNYSHTVYEEVRKLVLNDGVQIVDSPLWQYEGLVTAMHGAIPVVVRLQTSMAQIAEIQNTRNQEIQLMCELERVLARHSKHLMPNSFATFKVAQEHGFQFPANQYTVIPHGIIPVSDDAVRLDDYNQARDIFTILYVGRLEKRKGILDLFQAIPRVLARIPNAQFVIAGADNSQHDGFQLKTGMDYSHYFARYYSQYMSQVSFTGRVSDDALQKLYCSCDLFVAPSLYESFGLIYLEAMNYAKPVIGCRAGGIPEVVEDGVTGILVEPGVPNELADAIISLLQSPKRLREMGCAGRERLLRDFTYLKMAEAFEQVYRQVTNVPDRSCHALRAPRGMKM